MNALILVDIQNDFCPGGALAVPEGDAIVPLVNRVQEGYGRGKGDSPIFADTKIGTVPYDLVVATQDWHPLNHGSFAANHPGRAVGEQIELAGLPQILWPVHCVQNTPGAAFHPALNLDRVARFFRKGTDPTIDSYSGFFDNGHRAATGLGEYLRERGVEEVHLCGLATDYCVKFTALDAISLGFRVALLEDAARGVELRTGDVRRAIEEMRQHGVTII